MKKLFLSLTLSLFLFNSNAQVNVNSKEGDIDLNKVPGINYLEIVGTDVGLIKKKIVIAIDYGQVDRAFDKETTIKDANGKTVQFNSMIDALNFFEKNGWQYVSNYAVSTQNGSVYHFLIKKK